MKRNAMVQQRYVITSLMTSLNFVNFSRTSHHVFVHLQLIPKIINF